jgi:hypothetical protein
LKARKADAVELTDQELDALVLAEYPYPIAANYQHLLETSDWEARAHRCVEAFEFGLRVITLGVLGQYLLRDLHWVRDADLDGKLCKHLKQASLGQWIDFLFLTLHAYKGQRELLFMPELYDLHWDTSREPHRKRQGVRQPFTRLVQIRNLLFHLKKEKRASWQALCTEAESCLRTVLRHFVFLQGYDLIRLMGRQGDGYEYECYTGFNITTRCSRFQGDVELRPGWFYLARQDGLVLNLHPLFLFWTDDTGPESTEMARRDVAVYDRALPEAVQYVATAVRQLVERGDAGQLALFRRLFDVLNEKRPSPDRMPMSWVALRQAAEQVSSGQMGTAGRQHSREVYWQRGEILRAVSEFLTSDKACFVLTGKAGAGKTSFALSLCDELAACHDVAFLLYDAARVTVPTAFSVAEMISQDVGQYLMFQNAVFPNLFEELPQHEDMMGKVLIVVLDAINGNAEAGAWVQKLDQMLRDVRVPWLKVLVTSRPQTWAMLSQAGGLDQDLYYCVPDTGDPSDMGPENAIRLSPFDCSELPIVYEKYRQVYELQTGYQALKPPIRRALCDPLMLRLVAETYRGQNIPRQICLERLYEQYMGELIRTDRLKYKDIALLEQELTPLMLAEDCHNGTISVSQLDAAYCQDGRPLWALIRGDGLSGSRERNNTSYTRLLDAEILAEQGSWPEMTIGFGSRQIGEFFVGRHLSATARRVPNMVSYYEKVMTSLAGQPFLWGALIQAIASHMRDGNTDLFVSLVSRAADCVQSHSALVSALTCLGAEQPDRAKQLILELAGDCAPSPPSRLKAIRRWLLHGDAQADPIAQRQIALDAASELQLTQLLEDLATSRVTGPKQGDMA